MNYPVGTVPQLRAVLRALRKKRRLSQADLGKVLGVNQKRVAKIEASPGVTSFDQIARIVAALGSRIVIEHSEDAPEVPAQSAPTPRQSKKYERTSRGEQTW